MLCVVCLCNCFCSFLLGFVLLMFVSFFLFVVEMVVLLLLWMLIIDIDLGVDDVIVLLFVMVLLKELKIQVLIIVVGNVLLEKIVCNVWLVCEWGKCLDILVYVGVLWLLLCMLIYVVDVYGSEGIIGVEVYELKQLLVEGNVVDYLICILCVVLEKSVILVMFGLEINFVLVLIQVLDIVKGICEIVIMGGVYFNGGNIILVVEFNIFVDFYVVEIVFKSGVLIIMLLFDVIYKIFISFECIVKLCNFGNQVGKIVVDIFDVYVQYDIKYYGLKGGLVYDVMVVVYLFKFLLFKGKWINVQVDSCEGIIFGQIVVDWYGGFKQLVNVEWINEGDVQGFFDLFIECIVCLF